VREPDWSGDGKLDLVTADLSGQLVTVLLGKGVDGYATAINSSQQIAGYPIAPNGHFNGFFWSATTGLVDLGTLGGSNNNSWAFGINSAGQVTGTSAATEREGEQTAYTCAMA
jgi:probable HAF family extracellular repeat protein